MGKQGQLCQLLLLLGSVGVLLQQWGVDDYGEGEEGGLEQLDQLSLFLLQWGRKCRCWEGRRGKRPASCWQLLELLLHAGGVEKAVHVSVCHGGSGFGEHGVLHGEGNKLLWGESGSDWGLPSAWRRQVEDELGGSREFAQLGIPAR